MKANFTPKITKIQDHPGASPRRCSAPTGGLKVAPKDHAFEKKINAPPNQNSWTRPLTPLVSLDPATF